MKKIVSILLVAVMAVSLLAACGSDKPKTEGTPVASALEALQNIWASYNKNAGEDYQFPVGGGDSAHLNMEGPGEFDVTNTDELSYTLNLAAELHTQIDQAASMSHMMNANTFTAAAYHLVSGTDAKAFVTAATEGIKNTQWICGFPEKLVVATINGEYVVVVYGAGEILDLFQKEITTAYPQAEIAVNESL